MKLWKILLQAGVMTAGLILVLITLSGTTQTIGIWIAVISVVLFVLDLMFDEEKEE